jgi:hypothetical protein
MTDASLKTLSVDMSELCIALEAEAGEFPWFLDVETGDVILVTHEYDPEENGGLTRQDIEANPERFLAVPSGDPQETVADMRAFLGTSGDDRLKESLELALTAPRPERRFRSVLNWMPAELQRWHEFRLSRCQRRAHDWLTSLGIAAVPREASSAA